MDDATPWEDINPPMASAPRQELHSPSSVQTESRKTFRNELTACLTLVAPVGMNEEAKRDWLAVAWATLSHLPPDILTAGCRVARQTCDHPSKIVPTIIESTRESLERHYDRPAGSDAPRLSAPKPEYVSAAEAAEILREFGLKNAAG